MTTADRSKVDVWTWAGLSLLTAAAVLSVPLLIHLTPVFAVPGVLACAFVLRQSRRRFAAVLLTLNALALVLAALVAVFLLTSGEPGQAPPQ